MKTHIISIGNSQGIRLPKTLLKLCHIQKEVILDLKGNCIMIHPVREKTRQGWEEAFKMMRDKKEDRPLMDDLVDLEMENWEW